VTIPLMKTIDVLLQSDYLANEALAPHLMSLHALCVQECNKSKNIVKLIAAIGVFSGMLTYAHQELNTKALRSLLFLLFHSFPKVRGVAAEKLYTSLLTLEEENMELVVPGGEDDYEAVIELLSETDWAKQLKELSAECKEKIYVLFGQKPKAK